VTLTFSSAPLQVRTFIDEAYGQIWGGGGQIAEQDKSAQYIRRGSTASKASTSISTDLPAC
jgi:hypothetical protein